MFHVTGKCMERREFKTKKGDVIPVIVLWVKNGTRSNLYEFMDWENRLSDVQEGQTATFPFSVHANSSDRSVRAFLNMGVVGPLVASKSSNKTSAA